MHFRKTLSHHSRCTFPKCNSPTDRLRCISRLTRFKALKTKNLCIPVGARACNRHGCENPWDDNLIERIGPIQRFNRKQIEDMINLLRDSAERNTPNKSGLYFRTCINLFLHA